MLSPYLKIVYNISDIFFFVCRALYFSLFIGISLSSTEILRFHIPELAFHFDDNGIDVLSLVSSMLTALQDRISSEEISLMEFNLAKDIESRSHGGTIEHEFWPLEQVDPEKARFPCCVVWTPLPIVSWLAPFIGHVGICKEDGTILDFAGSYLINVNDYAFGPVARYLQLDREQVYIPTKTLFK